MNRGLRNQKVMGRVTVLVAVAASLLLPVVARAQPPPRTLKLSLKESIGRALQKNFEIQVERFNSQIRDQDIVREEAAFDPSVFADADANFERTPSISALTQIQERETETQAADVGVRQRLKTGTEYGVSFETIRSENNAAFITVDPAYTPRLNLTLRQNLLKNFGVNTNTTAIRVAQNDRQVSEFAFKDRVIQTISEVQDLYWELVFSIQDLEVKRQSLGLAQDLLRRNRIQVEVGTLAPIEIIQAEATVASREADVIVAERLAQDNEDLIKRGINLDPEEWDVPLEPTDEPLFEEKSHSLEENYQAALKNRPDHAQAKLGIETKTLEVSFERNQLLPTVDLKGGFGLNGLDDSFDDSISDFGTGDFFSWEVGVAFDYPFGNRVAKSRLTQRRLEVNQAQTSLDNLEQQIFLEVREAVRRVETDQKRVSATRAARVLSERKLDAEEKKLEVGLSTSFNVLEFQEDLAESQSNETRAITDYNQSLVNLDRTVGLTLEQHQIQLEKSP